MSLASRICFSILVLAVISSETDNKQSGWPSLVNTGVLTVCIIFTPSVAVEISSCGMFNSLPLSNTFWSAEAKNSACSGEISCR